jgi:hypothetical protein
MNHFMDFIQALYMGLICEYDPPANLIARNCVTSMVNVKEPEHDFSTK